MYIEFINFSINMYYNRTNVYKKAKWKLADVPRWNMMSVSRTLGHMVWSVFCLHRIRPVCHLLFPPGNTLLYLDITISNPHEN